MYNQKKITHELFIEIEENNKKREMQKQTMIPLSHLQKIFFLKLTINENKYLIMQLRFI